MGKKKNATEEAYCTLSSALSQVEGDVRDWVFDSITDKKFLLSMQWLIEQVYRAYDKLGEELG